MATLVGGNSGGSLTGDIGTPSDDDVVVLEVGSAQYDSGLDLTSGGTVELDTMRISSTFSGSIGGPGSSMEVDLSGDTYTGLFEVNSPANFVYVDPSPSIAKAAIYQTGPSGVFFTGGEVTACELNSGSAQFNSSCDLVKIDMGGGFAKVQTHASQTLDTANVYGGTLQTERNVGTAVVYNGSLMVAKASVTATSVTVGAGGMFRHIGGNITTLVALPGSTVDLSGLSDGITITNATRWPNVTYIRPPQGVSVTVTNPTEILGGGTFAT